MAIGPFLYCIVPAEFDSQQWTLPCLVHIVFSLRWAGALPQIFQSGICFCGFAVEMAASVTGVAQTA